MNVIPNNPLYIADYSNNTCNITHCWCLDLHQELPPNEVYGYKCDNNKIEKSSHKDLPLVIIDILNKMKVPAVTVLFTGIINIVIFSGPYDV